MGWKIELGIVGALLAGLILFRNQIKGVFGESGKAVGEGVGSAIGGFLGGIPSGFGQGVTSNYEYAGTDPSTGKKTTSPFGIPGPWDFLLNRNQQVFEPAYGDIGPGIGGEQPTISDEVVTPANRDYSDWVTIRNYTTKQDYGFKKQSSSDTAKLAQTLNTSFYRAYSVSNQAGAAIGHANKVREAARQSGAPPPVVTFEAVRQAALREGKTPGQALTIARQSLGTTTKYTFTPYYR